MREAISFWHMAYENGWFVRLSIVDKAIKKAGFTKSEHMLIGKTGYAYEGYWTIKK